MHGCFTSPRPSLVPLHPRRPLYHLLPLLLLLLLSAVPPCLSANPRQQHNVWYNGLFISGIAVDESSGDVFFSDAAANRVVRQSANGTLLAEYRSSFYSPMQLAYNKGTLYVADSTNNRVAMIDVASERVTFASPSAYLDSASALTVISETGDIVVVDGWGLQTEKLSPDNKTNGTWADWHDLSTSLLDSPPHYLASVARQSYTTDGSVWMTDPTQGSFYALDDYEHEPAMYPFDPPTLGVTAIHYDPSNADHFFVLIQSAADEPMHIRQIQPNQLNGTCIDNWIAAGKGGKPVPFIGWAMHVDSQRNMYISDRGVDEDSPYGRVVKIAPGGTELGNWSMSDGTAYSFVGISYDSEATLDAQCAYWMTDSERGVVRVAADGSVLVPFYAAPVDLADGRTARLMAMAEDSANSMFNHTTLVLLDSSDPLTTKLWRFHTHNGNYTLLNTSGVALAPNITAVAIDPQLHAIFLSSPRDRRVLRLDPTGQPFVDDIFNTSAAGFVEPGSLLVRCIDEQSADIFVVDSKYGRMGAVLQLDADGGELMTVFNSTKPAMWRPISITLDTTYDQLYIADSNGYVFQMQIYDGGGERLRQLAAHRPVPIASNIVSMTISAIGNVYMLDAYSRRLIILSRNPKSWNLGYDCKPVLPMFSSSSASAWSSSSAAPSPSVPRSRWSDAATVGLAVVGVLAVAVASSCYYVTRKRRRAGETDMSERLMAEQQVEKDSDEEAEAKETDVEVAEQTVPVAQFRLRYRSADDEASEEAVANRFEYYVARYEVVAEVSGTEQLDELKPREPHSPAQAPMRSSQSTLQLPASSARSPSPAGNAASAKSALSNSASSDVLSFDPSRRMRAVLATAASAATSAAGLASPSHIAALQSAWPRNSVTFIDSVTDLTILGEGSSGVVYRGVYQNTACVVKLPKSVSLTGASWREWQCHLSLPPHPHLVRFLGALPMSATNYLVLAFVRQGSLHSLLTSSDTPHSWYSRPYGVMRCLRAMSSALRHMHSAGIVHRDVSCRNILVDSDGSTVLADLGLATQLSASDEGAQQSQQAADSLQTAVPVRWTSPEALASSLYSSKSDVWSLGVALWEMTAGGALPYGEQQLSTKACIRPIIAGQLILYVNERWCRHDSFSLAEQRLADAVRRLIQLCLTFEVEQRPDSEQLVALVEREWQQWQTDTGGEAVRLEAEWMAWHGAVQQRLGPPCTPCATSVSP